MMITFSRNAPKIPQMKTPERLRTSHVGHFLVLSPQNSLCGVMWRLNVRLHDVTSLHMSLRWGQTSLNSAKLLCNEIWCGDLDLWPTTLTYNPSLAKVKVNSHTKNQGHRSNGSAVRVLTHRQTDTHTHTETRLRFYDLDRWRGR